MNIVSKIKGNLIVMLFFVLIRIPVYAEKTGPETIYLHTDRTVYVAGESIRYKLYVLDGVTQKLSYNSKVGYIEIRAAYQLPAIQCRVKIDAGISNGSILLPDTLTSGVYQLVAFTSFMKNYNESGFFRNEIVVINSFDKDMNFKLLYPDYKIVSDSIDKPFNIIPNKKIYNTREKVSVRIDKTGINANLSVSVFENPRIQTSCNSITELMHKAAIQHLDMLVNKKYVPEQNGKILRGSVLDSITGQPVANATVLLSCIDSVPNLQVAKTNSEGLFQLLLNEYYEGKELFLTIRDMPSTQHWKIEREDEFSLSEKWNPTFKYDTGIYNSFFVKSENIAYINQNYPAEQEYGSPELSGKKAYLPQLYYCSVNPVILSDYTPLNDFKEIVRELFPQVRITKENGNYRVSVLNGSQKMFSDAEIAIFLDGVYVDDLNKIMGLGSEQIKKIEILNTERIFGNLVYKGVISIISKSSVMVKTTPSSWSLRFRNDRFNGSDNYVEENPDSIHDKRTPYFRQLLYWNPNLALKEGESTGFDFITSDNEGNFLIKVEGISDDGRPLSFTSEIQVIKHLSAEK